MTWAGPSDRNALDRKRGRLQTSRPHFSSSALLLGHPFSFGFLAALAVSLAVLLGVLVPAFDLCPAHFFLNGLRKHALFSPHGSLSAEDGALPADPMCGGNPLEPVAVHGAPKAFGQCHQGLVFLLFSFSVPASSFNTAALCSRRWTKSYKTEKKQPWLSYFVWTA